MSERTIEATQTPLHYVTTINGVRVWIKRDDLNHPSINGNKLHKLKYNLIHAQKTQSTLISFGGAYSNHIAALASAGQYYQLPTVGIIRGEELQDKSRWSPVLVDAARKGMQLHFVSRSDYRSKSNAHSIRQIIDHYANLNPNTLVIPEGGSNHYAIDGVSELIPIIKQQSIASGLSPNKTLLALACGTGGTMAGMIEGVYRHQFEVTIYGIAVLNNTLELTENITRLSANQASVNWRIISDYTFGGYGKSDLSLTSHIENMKTQFNLPLEPIYTGKLVYAIWDLLSKHKITNDHYLDVILYHSGGVLNNL